MHVKKCGQAVGPDPHISILEDFMTEQLYEHENHELVRTASDRIEEFLIAPQYLLAKFPVVFLLEPNRCLLGNNVDLPIAKSPIELSGLGLATLQFPANREKYKEITFSGVFGSESGICVLWYEKGTGN